MRILILIIIALLPITAKAEPATDITITVDNYPSSPVILGYYFNGQMLVKDTVTTDAKGVAHYVRNEKLPEGIYLVFFPQNQHLFDIIISDDQTFSIKCDTLPDVSSRVQAKGCNVLSDFIDYQNYLKKRSEEQKALSDAYKALAPDDNDGKERIRTQFAEIDKQVKAHNNEMIERNKDNFLSVFLRSLKEIEVPKTFDVKETGAARDSALQAKRYYYYREHYFDNIDFADDRLLRTPTLMSKVDKYFDETLPQLADTVALEAIKIIEKSRPNKECFRFYVSHFYNMANNSKIMGMDAALVIIADKYYLSGEADWAEKKFIDDLREQIENIRYTLIGKQAVDLKMISNTGEWFKLSETSAPFTILVFWEPSCGHCKKEIPELKKQVWDKYKKDGIKIFAVYCQVEPKEWEEFIEEHELDEWINVYDPYGRTGFRKYYNIKSTPQIYILDKDKKIIAKKIGVEQIGDFLDFMMGKDKQQ
ncbi:MAG: redoxin domain-containing protein [Bacteroidales bacterium]|nr:redoxin domain-containing protein [Bacteroidales bacterium]